MTDDAAERTRRASELQNAFALGQAALGAGDRTEAARWLHRAHRLAPYDGTITLLLASAMIGDDNAAAAVLFAEVVAVNDVRDAWLGLATSHFLIGDSSAAAAALAKVLGQHTCRPEMADLADQVARATGAPGWCGLIGDGPIGIHPNIQRRIDTHIDGVLVEDGELPSAWPLANRITVMAGGYHLIGSPITPQAIGRITGYVEACEGGLRGWAWHPADPETDPYLSVGTSRKRRNIVATAAADGIPDLPPLARPRSFAIPWTDLPVGSAPIHLTGRDGRDLLGSPVVRDRAESDAAPASSKPRGPSASPRRPIAVIIQPRDGADDARSLVESILATTGPNVPIILRSSRGITSPWALGTHRVVRFHGEIGPGMAVCRDHDVVLLDSMALLPPRWLERLHEAAYAASDVGTVIPFSNRGAAAYPFPDGSDLAWFADDTQVAESQPDHQCRAAAPEHGAPPRNGTASPSDPDRDTTIWLDRLTRRANRGTMVPVPAGGGPCLFIRADCLAQTGPFRARLFARGHGAQEDFCVRAASAGWRNVIFPGLFVGQRHGMPAAEDRAAWNQLRARNDAILERLHPGLGERIDAARFADPLAPSRRRLDLVRWRADKRETSILVTHNDGGGVERRVQAAVAAHDAQGRRAVVLRPVRPACGTVSVLVDGDRFPNARFELPREQSALARLLRGAKPVEAELHHFLNHDPSVLQTVQALGVPYDVHAHDFAWFCPRIALVGRGDRYCGEPARAGCEACVAELGGYLNEDIGVTALLDRSRAILSGARQVVAPSRDAAARMARHFPGISVSVIPHEDDDAIGDPPPIPRVDGTVRVCVAGAIGLHKGFHVLLACARDARKRDLDLTFVVAGTTIDDQRLIDTGRAFVTGPYQAEEAVPLIRAQNAALALLPSIWPETWCLGLTELWRAGMRVAAFDIGAPAERIRRTGRGFLLPLGLAPRAINDALLNAARG